MHQNLRRLLVFKEMHSIQVIALVGLVMSVIAQGIMLLFQNLVPSFGYIYPTWAGIFLLGYFLNLNSKPGHDDHHH